MISNDMLQRLILTPEKILGRIWSSKILEMQRKKKRSQGNDLNLLPLSWSACPSSSSAAAGWGRRPWSAGCCCWSSPPSTAGSRPSPPSKAECWTPSPPSTGGWSCSPSKAGCWPSLPSKAGCLTASPPLHQVDRNPEMFMKGWDHYAKNLGM